jgi:periplasmic mercuric ion binding protein
MRTLILSLIAFVGLQASAQQPKHAALDIQTNAVCDMCEQTIEKEMIYEKGVKHVDVVLASNIVHVEYDDKKTTPEKLRTALTKLGYAADGQLPDAKAREALPDCCKKEGCGLPAKE